MIIRKTTCISISILVLSVLTMLPQTAIAQRNKSRNIERVDSVPFFNDVSMGIDLVGMGQKWLSSYGQYEGMVRINLKDRYFPVAEIGIGEADHVDDVTNINYKTSAPYFRIGCDFNVMKNKHDIYRIYVGARLAHSSFKYDATALVKDPTTNNEILWGSTDNKGTMLWMEAVGGLEAKIWGPIHLGWLVRYKNRISQKMGNIGEPWYVPGFGRNDTSLITASFNIIYQF